MSSRERLAIVGGGVIGLAIAFELARRGGCEIVVFDAGEAIAGRATLASAGMLAPYTEAHSGGPLFDLTVRGLAVYDSFVHGVREVSPASFEFRRSGTLEVALDPDRASVLRSRLKEPWSAAAALEWLSADALRRSAPCVSDAALGALWCAEHGYVAVRAFADAMADAARRLGVAFEVGARVTRIDTDGTDVAVQTEHGKASFDRIVLSAGAWSPQLDPLATLASRIAPLRGQLVRLSCETRAFDQILWSEGCYMVPWNDGTVLVGATSEDVGFDARATMAGVESLLAAARALAPILANATFKDVLVGLRPAAQALPILGPGVDPRIIYAAGHHRNGVLLAPLTARLIADHIFTNAVDPSFVTT